MANSFRSGDGKGSSDLVLAVAGCSTVLPSQPALLRVVPTQPFVPLSLHVETIHPQVGDGTGICAKVQLWVAVVWAGSARLPFLVRPAKNVQEIATAIKRPNKIIMYAHADDRESVIAYVGQ